MSISYMVQALRQVFLIIFAIFPIALLISILKIKGLFKNHNPRFGETAAADGQLLQSMKVFKASFGINLPDLSKLGQRIKFG